MWFQVHRPQVQTAVTIATRNTVEAATWRWMTRWWLAARGISKDYLTQRYRAHMVTQWTRIRWQSRCSTNVKVSGSTPDFSLHDAEPQVAPSASIRVCVWMLKSAVGRWVRLAECCMQVPVHTNKRIKSSWLVFLCNSHDCFEVCPILVTFCTMKVTIFTFGQNFSPVFEMIKMTYSEGSWGP